MMNGQNLVVMDGPMRTYYPISREVRGTMKVMILMKLITVLMGLLMGVRKLPEYSYKMSILIEKSLNDTLGLEKGDCNGKNQNVIWQSQFNQNSGRRADSYSCFAAPYVGKGLTVLTFAHATKLIMSDLTAKGVEVERFGKKLELFAKNEVIVSAGAIGSPQLLMLSGT